MALQAISVYQITRLHILVGSPLHNHIFNSINYNVTHDICNHIENPGYTVFLQNLFSSALFLIFKHASRS